MRAVRRRPSPGRSGLRLATATALTLIAACARGSAPAPSPSPTPTPTEESPPAAIDVRGDVAVEVFSVHNGPAVFNAGDPNSVRPEPDAAAIDAFVASVTGWLDRHLSDLQGGGAGFLQEVAAPGLIEGSSPEALGAVTTDLANPDRAVSAARYRVRVAERGPPDWLHVTADVTGPDGTVATAQYVFRPGPVLLAAGQAGAPAEAPA